MNTLIVFREGLSGHYLKALITDSNESIGFRVDPWYPNRSIKLQTFVTSPSCVCVHPHELGPGFDTSRFDLWLNIQVHDKIYHACYNNFHKKYLIENPHDAQRFPQWQNDFVYWYDRIFYNMRQYHELYTSDRVTSTFSNVIDFDHLLEEDYIAHILDKYYNEILTPNRSRIISTYRSLQVPYNLHGQGLTMQEIAQDIPSEAFRQSPWFAVYCIFCFEINNGYREDQRLWSIDNLRQILDPQSLIDLQSQYKS